MRLRRRPGWTAGNAIRLLENGEEFYPVVFEAIRTAQREVQIETFIIFEDHVGWALHQAMLEAANRGVQVDLLVDGFGSSDLTEAWLGPLAAAGVRIRVFDPRRRFLGLRTNLFRRMHRKIVVVDGERAFVGGINYSADHLASFGPEAKQDYAVEVRGPVVAQVHAFARESIVPADGRRPRWWTLSRWRRPAPASPPAAQGSAEAVLVVRDNDAHATDIERHYRIALRAARQRVIIANAYFFPGWRLLRELRRAARRGVRVDLILQGEPDMAIVKTAASLLYEHLIRAGVHIHEYCKRPLHGKVAVVDDTWATVGSSNLDPLSLSLNLEANLSIRDRDFNQLLAQRLEKLMCESCTEIDAATIPEQRWWAGLRNTLVFHFLRRFPSWASWLPAHVPRLAPADALADIAASPDVQPVTEAHGPGHAR